MLREEAIDWFNELIKDSAGKSRSPMDAARKIVAFLHSDSSQARDFRNVLYGIIKQTQEHGCADLCDEHGRIWNNADPTSGQCIPCPTCRPGEVTIPNV